MNETNEVVEAAAPVAANIKDQLAAQFQNEFSHGADLWNQILAWISEQGLTFCINLALSIAMLLIGWLVIGRIGSLVGKAVSKALAKSGKDSTLFANFVKGVTTKACWAMLIVMILSRLGVNVGPLIAGLGVTGFILGFAFQESLGNLASGMMIAINQPFKVNDFIDAAGFSGTVKEVNMMATILSSPDNKKVVMPNKSVWGGPIVNYTALGKRRVDMKIGIAYGENIEKAVKIIKETVAKVPNVLQDPAPAVVVGGLDESQVSINVRPWASCDNYWGVYSATLEAVKAALEKAGISIPFPQLTIHQAKA